MATDPWHGTGAAQAGETGEDIVQILSQLAHRSRLDGLACASEVLDQAVIAVFNALFMDRQAIASATYGGPSRSAEPCVNGGVKTGHGAAEKSASLA